MHWHESNVPRAYEVANETPRQTTAALKNALAARYQAPEWAYFPEMRNGTGGNHSRTSDGFAMNCYPSRGLELHGFEIKASVGDLDAELRSPDKADALGRYMDFWWLVTTVEIRDARQLTIPGSWGIMVRRKERLVVVQKPIMIESETFPRSLLASILRRACKIDHGAIDAAKRDGINEGYRAAAKNSVGQGEHDQIVEKLRSLNQRVSDFESASGIQMKGYDLGRVGDGLKRMLRNEQAQVHAQNSLRDLKTRIETVLYS